MYQEFYGTVAWGVRGVFNSYIGWFGGDPAQLHPLSPQEYAERMQRLAGGADGLLLAAKCAFADGDSQWCLNCSQAIMRANSGKVEVVNDARQLALQSLRALASNQVSANGRNYYLTYARELEGSLTLKPSSGQVTSVVKHIGAVEVIKSLTIRLNAESCIDVICKVRYFEYVIKILTLLHYHIFSMFINEYRWCTYFQTQKRLCISLSTEVWQGLMISITKILLKTPYRNTALILLLQSTRQYLKN